MIENQGNICKNCCHRFRRIFIPIHSEEYEDVEGSIMVTDGENIIISNQCLVIDIDISGDETIECSHFEQIDKNEDSPLLKHLK